MNQTPDQNADNGTQTNEQASDAATAATGAPHSVAASDGKADSEIDMQFVKDIPVTVSVEVGQSMISIRNLLLLNQGSIVELDRKTGEPLDVKVNGYLVAHAEVVVVNDKYGIRLTDVVSQSDRYRKVS